MSLNDITQKILSDAQAEAERIARSARREVRHLKKEAEQTKKAYERESDEETKQLLESKERATLSRVRREAQQIVSAQKRASINAVIADMRKKISGDISLQEVFLRKRIAALDASVREIVTAVHVPQSHADDIAKICTDAGIRATIIPDQSIDAGAVIITPSADYDMTLERLVADNRSLLEGRIAQILFPDMHKKQS